MSDFLLKSNNESSADVPVESTQTNLELIKPFRCSGVDEVPERDVPQNKRKKVGKACASMTPEDNVVDASNTEKNQNAAVPRVDSSDSKTVLNTNLMCLENEARSSVGNAAMRLAEDLENDRRYLKELAEKEKSLRKGVEESAKKVYIQLQKVESELCREKEMKESLLFGTLQLKNLLHENYSKTNELNVDISESKAEIQRLTSEIQALSLENTNTVHRLKYLCQSLGFETEIGGSDLKQESDSTALYVDFLKSHIHHLVRKSNNEDSKGQVRIRKLTEQINTCVGRFAKLEKERDQMHVEWKYCQERETHFKHQLHTSQVALSTIESELLKKQIEYECTLQKIQSEFHIEKDKSLIKVAEYCSVIQRSKELLISLRNERDDSRKRSEKLKNLTESIQQLLKETEADKYRLQVELDKVNANIRNLKDIKDGQIHKLQNEKMKLEENFKRAATEKKKCMELLRDMKHHLINLKNKTDHDIAVWDVEKKQLKNENKRLEENFRVLQKVSEDQGHTIVKLRGDLEIRKESNFRLESEIRNHESAENELIRKLEQTEKYCEKYSKHIDQLEDKIERYAEDMKLHDCDDYADSKYKKKLKEVEEQFHSKSRDWHDSQRKMETEKDDAITVARNAIQQIEELKKVQESQASGFKSKVEADMTKLNDQHKRETSEKLMKIHQLQTELGRLKLSSSQIQRALSTKIQQLQAALGICLGGGSNHNNSNLGLGQTLHQLYHPVAAFGSVNGSCNNANNNDSFGNLLNTPGHQPETYNPNSFNQCAAGISGSESNTCPPAQNFDFGNLIL